MKAMSTCNLANRMYSCVKTMNCANKKDYSSDTEN